MQAMSCLEFHDQDARGFHSCKSPATRTPPRHATFKNWAKTCISIKTQTRCVATTKRLTIIRRELHPALQTHAGPDGLGAKRIALLRDQLFSSRECTLGRGTGCGNGKMVSGHKRQTRIAAGLPAPPLQHIK